MSEKKVNLSGHDLPVITSADKFRIGLLVSEWNPAITGSMRDACCETLLNCGIRQQNILIFPVPGSFELSTAAGLLCDSGEVHAVICIGCVIQGETRHFEFICQAVAQGITRAGLDYRMPVIFGVLTTDTYEQAFERAGGKHGNKGTEAAVAALKMLGLMQDIYAEKDPDKLFEF
jgi:6,7-dimethyl-8-ribityllumazine synthase